MRGLPPIVVEAAREPDSRIVRAVAVRGVLFDFYGTLSVSATHAERQVSAARVATALGVPADELLAAIRATFTQRATGACGDLEATMLWLAKRCGHVPTTDQLRAACEVRRATETIYAQALRPDAEATLRDLRDRGLRVGVLSDCTHELPEIWPSLPIAAYVDAVLFSVQAGLRKPHPTLFSGIATSLGVPAHECLYVGDGGSGELTGATQAGMSAVQLVAADAADALVYDLDTAWSGPTVGALSDVLLLAG